MGITYTSAGMEVLDAQLSQAYYRQLGMVSVRFGVGDMYQAAMALSTPSYRGGTVSWAVYPDVLQWDGIRVAPEVPMSPTFSVWIFGSAMRQVNAVVVKKGFYLMSLSKTIPNLVVHRTYQIKFPLVSQIVQKAIDLREQYPLLKLLTSIGT